jgi:hypothetical protein
MTDRQLVAFAGQPNGRIALVDWRQQPNHRVIRGAGDFTPITVTVGDIDADPAQWEDALKISGCTNLTVFAGVVRGGREDCVDVMRSRHCAVFIEDAYPRGKYVSTQKGESHDITLTIQRQHGHGSEVDHDYGNRADNDNGQTTNCRLSVKALLAEGAALVRVLRATAPGLDGGPFVWAFPSPFAWYHGLVVWLLNRLQ